MISSGDVCMVLHVGGGGARLRLSYKSRIWSAKNSQTFEPELLQQRRDHRLRLRGGGAWHLSHCHDTTTLPSGITLKSSPTISTLMLLEGLTWDKYAIAPHQLLAQMAV